MNSKDAKKKDLGRLTKFLASLHAAAQIVRRATENGYVVEVVVVAAAVIDAALRMGLVLQHQIDTKSTQIPLEWLFQGESERSASEREIYRKAFDKKIISKELYDKLEALYVKRNRVVHRYVISDITTKEVFEIAVNYEKVIAEVNRAIWEIEELQIKLGVGMTRRGSVPKPDIEHDRHLEMKHGAPWLSDVFAINRLKVGGDTGR